MLTGCRELLQPEFLPHEVTGDVIGPTVQVAKAYWISPGLGNKYHCFLQDEPGDRRTQAMALSLMEEFGTRIEPLLVLPELLDEVDADEVRKPPATEAQRRSQRTVLSEILAFGNFRQLRLYGLALPTKADPEECWAVPAGIVPGTVRDRIEKLRTLCAIDMKPESIQAQVIEATPELPIFSTLYNNSLCNNLVLRLVPRLSEQGWTCEPETFACALFKILSNWNRKGIYPTLPLHAHHLDAITEFVYKRLL